MPRIPRVGLLAGAMLVLGGSGTGARGQMAPGAGGKGSSVSETVSFIAAFLPSHARVRRDSFDDVDWGGGDYYVKGVAGAAARECVVDIDTRGSGSDYRIEVDFRHSLTFTRHGAP